MKALFVLEGCESNLDALCIILQHGGHKILHRFIIFHLSKSSLTSCSLYSKCCLARSKGEQNDAVINQPTTAMSKKKALILVSFVPDHQTELDQGLDSLRAGLRSGETSS